MIVNNCLLWFETVTFQNLFNFLLLLSLYIIAIACRSIKKLNRSQNFTIVALSRCINLYCQLHQWSVNCEHRCSQLTLYWRSWPYRFIHSVYHSSLLKQWHYGPKLGYPVCTGSKWWQFVFACGDSIVHLSCRFDIVKSKDVSDGATDGNSGSSGYQNDQQQPKGISLTLRPPSTTIVPYANSLDLNETLSNSASHPDPSCLTLGQHFQKTFSNINAFWKLKQTRNVADDNGFGGLNFNMHVNDSQIYLFIIKAAVGLLERYWDIQQPLV